MKLKYLLILVIIACFFILSLIIYNSEIKTLTYRPAFNGVEKYKENPEQEKNLENQIDIKSEYQKEVSRLLFFYENLIKEKNFSGDDIVRIKTDLLSLKLPEEYKKLHLDFLYSLINAENYTQTKKLDDYSSAMELIINIKEEINWI